ncbi:MAG: hypothetical protein OEQ13_04885, partial [Acidobacteriota bacterium]|nr:hypothetical protein [Acidobacteriota bacterium]
MSDLRARHASAPPTCPPEPWIVVVTVLVCAALAACGSPLENLPREGDLHPRLTRFAYIEEGKLISFIVDTAATRRREGVPFIPVGVGVANIGLKQISLTRESFTLID